MLTFIELINASALKENRVASDQGRDISVLTYTTVVSRQYDCAPDLT